MFLLNRLNEEELMVDFVKNPNNSSWTENLAYVKEKNTKFLSQFFAIARTIVKCDACGDLSTVFEPSVILSLSLRSDSVNRADIKHEEIILFRQEKIEETTGYTIPIDSSFQLIADILKLMKETMKVDHCSIFIVGPKVCQRIPDYQDLTYALNQIKDPKTNKLVVAAHKIDESQTPIVEVPFKLRWERTEIGKVTMHSDYNLPLVLTPDNYNNAINNIVTNIEAYTDEWSTLEDKTACTVEVGLFDRNDTSHNSCVLCGKVECFKCFFDQKDDFDAYMRNKFSSIRAPKARELMTSMEKDAENLKEDADLKIIFKVYPEPHNLEVPKKGVLHFQDKGSKRIETIEDLLQLFSSTETLKDEDKITCSKCHQKECSQKSTKLVFLPQILILHIKRFKFTDLSGFTKNNQKITFDEELDLEPFYDRFESQNVQTENDHFEKRLTRVKISTHYRLRAVVNHQGSLHGGHYFSYVFENDSWSEYNDETVSSLDPGRLVSEKAYILFYERM